MQKKMHDKLRIRDSLKDIHIDVPDKLSDRDKIGRVKRVSTSGIEHMRGGGTFDEQ